MNFRPSGTIRSRQDRNLLRSRLFAASQSLPSGQCLNLDSKSSRSLQPSNERSLMHITRQGLTVFQWDTGAFWSIHPETHSNLLRSPRRSSFTRCGSIFWNLPMHTDEAMLLHMPRYWCWAFKYRRSLRTTRKNITHGTFKVTHALMPCCVAHLRAYRSQRNRRVETSPSQGIFIGTIERCTSRLRLIIDQRNCRTSARLLIRMVKKCLKGQLWRAANYLDLHNIPFSLALKLP